MGVLTVGRPLSWEEALPHLRYVRDHGVLQFINHYRKYEHITKDALYYGDEIEYGLFALSAGGVALSLRGAAVRATLNARELEERRAIPESGKVTWHPEYGSWMVESTPAVPYSGFTDDLRRVETNMRSRRARLLAALEDGEVAPTMVVFPLLGCDPPPAPGPAANSRLVPDAVINPHPRFGALTANIRARRGSNVDVRSPVFADEKTAVGDIAMDAMAFGMGCCCLQVTFQCRDVDESRHVYDQLAVLAPVMLALTAACPILKGLLSDHDVRWNVIEQSVDCRTPAERSEPGADASGDDRMANRGVKPVGSSRYSGVKSYMSARGTAARYNDVEVEVDPWAFEQLTSNGVDALLARHVAHLFVRDPLVLFEGMVEELDDAVATDHFDNLQSTNWNTVRLKPPVGLNPEGEPGWRTEFRPMEVQLTDFENAAFSVFTVLVTRVILAFDLSLYVPLSRVDANMRRAQRRDAVNVEKFYFRRQLAPTENEQNKFNNCCGGEDDDVFEEMTCAEIIDGKGDYFPGLAPLAYAYLDHIGCDQGTFARISDYIELVRKKARGEAWTGAKWIREFVTNHPDYNRDSVISPKVARDLAVAAHEVGVGARDAKALTGGVAIKPVSADGAWDTRLSPDKIPTADERKKLLLKYAKRGPFEGKFDPVFWS
mmetsp:Transcript_28186/g.93312  ORF Transcript_28186/g.93312 Transcript_28186/m.93312 type:complete len:660 (+) Transcript_28186:160-2139(+)